MKDSIRTKANGIVSPKKGSNKRIPYEHQKQALKNLDIIDESPSYSTLVVLPTGGGKTYTASLWLLKHALNQHKKILWLAHRQTLLDQAAESFQNYAFAENLPNISSFRYRIISGAINHDRPIDIKPEDDLLIVSKDSIGRNLKALNSWLDNNDELYLVIDEAHHATARTYRKIINYVKAKVSNTKVIGLTATPFRTAETEQGLLAKVFTDGIVKGKISHGNSGISYQIGLKELINRRILSRPIFKTFYTEEALGENLGLDDMDKISHLDILPEDIAGQLADSAARNNLIVKTYKENQDIYGQTIVFAVNVIHAIALAKLFKNAGISSDFIVSDIKDIVTGVTISREENEQKLEAYRSGKLQVLVNVNILTEGVDLPQTKTVFLARPTVSTILMTQMIGRALRGEAAGGTSEAYIVSFVDDWKGHIAWVNPESLFMGNENDFSDNVFERQNKLIRMIAISKIEEFASILDNSVDTSTLEKIPFEERIPIGLYAFTYLEKEEGKEEGIDHTYQVMVYNSTQKAYSEMMDSLPIIFEDFKADEEFLPKDTIRKMAEQIQDTFFIGEVLPPYEEKDIINILKYYAQNESVPTFYTFDSIDRSKLDVAAIAKKIWDEDMGRRKQTEYIDSLWDDSDNNMLNLFFFGRKTYFWKQIDIELMKLSNPDIYEEEQNVKYGSRNFEDMTLHEIKKVDPKYEKELRDRVFDIARGKDKLYKCALCSFKSKNRVSFQVDHIKPLSKRGKTVPENLQLLCRTCNGRKSDK